LYISDLDLTPSIFPPALGLSNIDIELEDLCNPHIVLQLVAKLGDPQSSVSITGCAVELLPDYWGALSLTRIPEEHDLTPILRSCRGTKLSLHNCPGFNDGVLRMMIISSYDSGHCQCAPYVRRLHISNCPNISATELKRLVEIRRLCMNDTVPITELRLYGDVPQLLPNELRWFESRVPQFSYCRFRRDDIEL
jgi:hypothetical protein